jgi:hypothetical protein
MFEDDRDVVEKLKALMAKYPELKDGKHDKQLIASYLEEYHGHVIPPKVLKAMPSFETLRRERQKIINEGK